MFVPLEPTAWPAPGEVRDLRVSLNAPVILGHGGSAEVTRAALGWIPASGPAVAVRLWLRCERSPARVRGFELRDHPLGPAARATALERAESFLAGLGFLFDGLAGELCAGASPAPATGSPQDSAPDPGAPGQAVAPLSTRTSDPDPVPAPTAAHAVVATAVRADIGLTRHRRPLPGPVLRRPSPAPSPRGLLARLFRSRSPRPGGIET